MKKFPPKSKKVLTTVFIVLGFLLLLYPTISGLWNSYVDSKIKVSYNESLGKVDVSKELKKAEDYNTALSKNDKPLITRDSENKDEYYESLLSIDGTGTMGYIDIPCISVSIPIYHYSASETLDKGIGHIQGTSLPIGGKSSHSVLTGHRGLLSEKLLTDLDEVKIGDKFYIHILGETLAYECDDIKVVLPEEVDGIKIEEGKDYVTLVTCTPYAVNSHRLLVRGKRVPYEGEKTTADVVNKLVHSFDINQYIGLIIAAFIILVFIVLKITRKGKG